MEAAPKLPSDASQALDRPTVGDYAPFARHLARPDDPRPAVRADAPLEAGLPVPSFSQAEWGKRTWSILAVGSSGTSC
jgi:hypothetical protein